MKKIFPTLLVTFFLSIMIFSSVMAQSELLILHMSRDWGYGGFNGEIEGLFSMKVSGLTDLARVVYYIDDTKIGEVDQAPFNLQFTTDQYPLGNHKLYAVGFSNSGQEYRSNILSANFVLKQSSTKVILPILGVVFAAILLSTFGPLLIRRGKHLNTPLGDERNYGVGGGGICPNCQRPFPLPLLSAHLGASKFAACPYCGKWSLVRMESVTKLREAEKAETEGLKVDPPLSASDDDKSHKEIEDSKYQEL